MFVVSTVILTRLTVRGLVQIYELVRRENGVAERFPGERAALRGVRFFCGNERGVTVQERQVARSLWGMRRAAECHQVCPAQALVIRIRSFHHSLREGA